MSIERGETYKRDGQDDRLDLAQKGAIGLDGKHGDTHIAFLSFSFGTYLELGYLGHE